MSPVPDALLPGPGNATEDAGLDCHRAQFAQGVDQETANPEGCEEREIRKGNAARSAARFSAAGLMAIALQG